MSENNSGGSAAAWREWFDRLGPAASVDAVNATANLVITERDLHAEPLMREADRLADNENRLLRAIESACHAWNQTPSDYRSPLMQEAINQLSTAHQEVMRSTPKK